MRVHSKFSKATWVVLIGSLVVGTYVWFQQKNRPADASEERKVELKSIVCERQHYLYNDQVVFQSLDAPNKQVLKLGITTHPTKDLSLTQFSFDGEDKQSLFILHDSKGAVQKVLASPALPMSVIPFVAGAALHFPLHDGSRAVDHELVRNEVDYRIQGHLRSSDATDWHWEGQSLTPYESQDLPPITFNGSRFDAIYGGKPGLWKTINGQTSFRVQSLGQDAEVTEDYSYEFVRSEPVHCSESPWQEFAKAENLVEIDLPKLRTQLSLENEKKNFAETYKPEERLDEILRMANQDDSDGRAALRANLQRYFELFPEKQFLAFEKFQSEFAKEPLDTRRLTMLLNIISEFDSFESQDLMLKTYADERIKNDSQLRQHLVGMFNFFTKASNENLDSLASIYRESAGTSTQDTALLALGSYASHIPERWDSALSLIKEAASQAKDTPHGFTAIGAAGNLETPDAVSFLQSLTRSDDSNTSQLAIQALARQPSQTAETSLFAMIDDRSLKENVRNEAIRGLCSRNKLPAEEPAYRNWLEDGYLSKTLTSSDDGWKSLYGCILLRGSLAANASRSDENNTFIEKIKTQRQLKTWETLPKNNNI